MAAAIVFAVVAAGPPASGAASDPRIAVDRPAAAPGARVTVTGEDLVRRTTAQVALCGNLALRGTADCDLARARTVVPDADGRFQTALTVAVPPAPCPCAIVLISLSLRDPLRVPFRVDGAATAPLSEAAPGPEPRLKVERAALVGTGPWTSWFGASPTRTLVLRVRNIGDVALDSPPVIVRSRKVGLGSLVIHPPDLGTLQPGEARTYRVRVELGAFSSGRFEVTGRIGGFGDDATFESGTNAFPWGLLALGLVMTQVVLLALRNRARRALVGDTGDASPAPGDQSDAALTGAGAEDVVPWIAIPVTAPGPWARPGAWAALGDEDVDPVAFWSGAAHRRVAPAPAGARHAPHTFVLSRSGGIGGAAASGAPFDDGPSDDAYRVGW